MRRGCVPGLVHRWLWFEFPGEWFPEEGEIAIKESTGSCYLILSIKPSRKGGCWRSVRLEGLGVDAASLDDEGTFELVPRTHETVEAIRLIEAAERMDARDVPRLS